MTPTKNAKNLMGGANLFASVAPRTAALVNLDPQYRTVLDAMKYGNEGARQKRRATLPQMSDNDIVLFLHEAERVLKPGHHVLLWVDKYIVGEARHRSWIKRTELELVELFVWNKTRPGMGKRGRCYGEFLIVLQKPPVRAKGFWNDRMITDIWPESVDTRSHPHAKPIAFMTRLVRSLTKRGDLVVDPCAGGYGMLDVCLHTGREFLGCDLVE